MVPSVPNLNTVGYLGCQCALVDTITHSFHFGPTIFIMGICESEPLGKDTVLTKIKIKKSWATIWRIYCTGY
jgi:hypothetical protein